MVIVHPQWVLFGDSITQHSWMLGGLGQHLSEAYQRRMDIVNRGYGGYNTTCGLEVAPHVSCAVERAVAAPGPWV